MTAPWHGLDHAAEGAADRSSAQPVRGAEDRGAGSFLGAILAEYLGSGGDSTLGRALIAAQTQSDAPQLWYLALVSGLISGWACPCWSPSCCTR
jgi:hypothetical protein